MRQGGDAHPQPLPRALPRALRVPAVPRHLHALRQPAHALQVQAPRVQPRHAQVRAARAARAAAAVREPPGRRLRLIRRLLARRGRRTLRERKRESQHRLYRPSRVEPASYLGLS